MVDLEVTLVEGLGKKITKNYTLDTAGDFVAQFSEICNLYGLEQKAHAKHCLLIDGKYINPDKSVNLATLFAVETKVELKLKPEFHAKEILYSIRDVRDKNHTKTLFSLKDTLQDEAVAEEFIAIDGVPTLVKYISNSKGNMQAYALNSLRSALLYVSAMNFISNSPATVSEIYFLTDTSKGYQNVSIIKNALELLIVICSYLEDGFKIIHKAAKDIAKRINQPTYQNLMTLVTSVKDLDVQTNCLILLNVMFSKAKDDRKRKKLLYHLNTKVDLQNVLSFLTETDYPAIREQLTTFQIVSNCVIPKSWYEADKYKQDLEKVTHQFEDVQEKLYSYQRQQPLIRMLRQELARCYETVNLVSSSSGLLRA